VAGDYIDRQAVIDLDAVAFNLSQVRRQVGRRVKIMAVVKADAYGHGLIPVSRRLVAEGAAFLGVGRLDEVETLRRAGLGVPVVILTGITPAEAEMAVRLRSLPMVFDLEAAEALAQAGRSLGRSAEALLKFDTGMSRLGFGTEGLDELMARLAGLEGLSVRGLASHMATADEADKTHARRQTERFEGLIARFRERKFELDLNSMANSAGVLDLPETHYDLVRPGIMLYGSRPGPEIRSQIELRPAMTVKTRLIQVRQVPAGTALSYGLTYTTPAPARIGVVPLGYGHGLPRHLSNQGTMLVGQKRVSVVGRVCMNLTLLDLTQVPEVENGDEVTALGWQGQSFLPAEEVAVAAGTISYEVLCLLGSLNPRVYLGRG